MHQRKRRNGSRQRNGVTGGGGIAKWRQCVGINDKRMAANVAAS